MLQTATPMLRRFWYPVMPIALLADGPKPFRLLGQDLVIWVDGEGRPSAMDDRCCHRTAKLSKGFYSNGWLACGYHGWEFDADGRVMRVPQRPVDRQGATNMRVPAYRAELRYGYVWVALEEPLFDIPDFEEEGEGFRRIDEFYEVWNRAGLRVMENSFDNVHFYFDIIAFDRLVTDEDRDILESTDFDVPLEQAGRGMNMPSDRPGVLMRRMLLNLLRQEEAPPVAKAAE